MSNVAIIGAGIAGLACARFLAGNGHEVDVFDKGRGPGGRMSTRRVSTAFGEASFDHGAQYFTARDPDFRAVLEGLIVSGFAAPWTSHVVRMEEGGEIKPLAGEAIYVGQPGMNGVIRGLLQGLNVTWGARVQAITRLSNAWQLDFESGGKKGGYDHIVCAVPAEQVAPLLQDVAPDIAREANAIASLPCWTGMFAFENEVVLPFDACKFAGHGVLDFVCSNGSKPARTGPPSYVVQAHSNWSSQHLEDDQSAVADALLAQLQALTANMAEPIHKSAHRWRYARVLVENGPQFLLDKSTGIAGCGDWLQGPRVESAWASGHLLGKALCEA